MAPLRPELARVGAALAHAKTLGIDRLDAQLLLQSLLQRDRAWLLAHDDEALSDPQQTLLYKQLQARVAGQPLAYVLGEWAFCGLRLKVGPAVLVPRPETEGLVEWALDLLGGIDSPKVLDLGTGSGAIALAIQAARPDAQVWASDAHADALAVAQENARRLGLPLRLLEPGSWWKAIPPGKQFALVVANPPYIDVQDPHLLDLAHEPRHALVAEDRGLSDLRHIVAGAPAFLESGGWLLLEHGHDQALAIQDMCAASNVWEEFSCRNDLAGLPRCSAARRVAVRRG